MWTKREIEVCENPEEGENVQFVALHIIQWERLKRDYNLGEVGDGRIKFYFRDIESSN